MIDLNTIKDHPELLDNLVFKLTGSDLKDFAVYCFEVGKKENPPPPPEDELLTPAQLSDILKVSLVTIWNWDTKGITKPVRIGNAKRYKKSDIEKLLKK